MITDQQVALLRQKLMEGKTQREAASSAAMSERDVAPILGPIQSTIVRKW